MTGVATEERMLLALAEQLKLPLLRIARTAELEQMVDKTSSENIRNISQIADNALILLEGYLLSTDRQMNNVLDLEPVSVSAVLNDTAHKLSFLAKQNNCDLKISLSGKYGPVMAHRLSLESALMLLGTGMIEARSQGDSKHLIELAVRKNRHGLTVGVFDNQPGLTSDALRRGRVLYGLAKQAMPTLSGANGANIFVADALFGTMETFLRVARHNKLTGLAATLQPSSQLSLI